MPESSPHDQLETDPRFPTGPWKGYYIQFGQRGWQQLNLAFSGGKIEGTALDKGGEAHVHGTYDLATGTVNLVKIYYYHKVEYRGDVRDKGIRGGFMIRYPLAIDTGDFYIWPDTSPDGAESMKTAATVSNQKKG